MLVDTANLQRSLVCCTDPSVPVRLVRLFHRGHSSHACQLPGKQSERRTVSWACRLYGVRWHENMFSVCLHVHRRLCASTTSSGSRTKPRCVCVRARARAWRGQARTPPPAVVGLVRAGLVRGQRPLLVVILFRLWCFVAAVISLGPLPAGLLLLFCVSVFFYFFFAPVYAIALRDQVLPFCKILPIKSYGRFSK